MTATALGANDAAARLRAVQAAVAAACAKARRDAAEVTLVAVSKTFDAEAVAPVLTAGQRVFGENRVQEFGGKAGAMADLAEAEWHMIGHLQTNKAAKAAELFRAVDSVDSVKLAAKLDAAAQASGKRLTVLIEVNVGGEEAKSGVALDSPELEQLLIAASGLQGLEFRGLMTVPPFTEDPEGARAYFRRLRNLRDGLAGRKLPEVGMDVLSMGMSHDFEVAIEEGSTCVRVGTAIFGERQKR